MNLVRMLSWALVASILAAGAGAQEKVQFDPTLHLPGFEETRSSEVKDLFPLDAYADLLGREMDAKELAEVQAKWKAESVAIQLHLDEVRSNPAVGVRWVLDKRMAQHKFFSKVTLTVDTSVPPFLIFVQKPSFDDPNYATSLVQLFAPYLKKVAAVFDERVAKPSGATRRVNQPFTPIVILASPGDFDNYERLGGPHDGSTAGADYDPKLDIVVFAVNSFEKPKATPAFLYPLLREVFLSLMRAHAAPQLKKVPSTWLREGLASAFTWPRAAQVDSLDKPEPRLEQLKLLIELCHKPDARTTQLQPVAELSSHSSSISSGAFRVQATLWMHFLSHAKEGKHRPRFEAYLKTAMAGQSGSDALSFAFAGTKLADLDKEFWAWVYDEHQRLLPNIPIDRNDLNGLFDPLPKPGENDELVARAKESLEKPEPPFDPSTLAIGEIDVQSRHGLALQSARSGDFESARTMLEALVKLNPTPPEDGRVARDLQRVSAAITLRDAFLAALIAKNGKLAIEVKGKKVNAPVVKVEGGQILFGENAGGARSLALNALDPVELARQTEKKELQGKAPAWTRPWLYLLGGDARWEKLVKTDSTEGREVKEDGAVWYPDRLQEGVAAKIVEGLSKAGPGKTRAEAEPVVEVIRDLMKTHSKTATVLFKKDALGRCARAALDVIAAESNGADFVAGKLTQTEQGATTLFYEFDDQAEADDFKINKGHLIEWRKRFPAGPNVEEKSTLGWNDGVLSLQGNAMWRLPIGFIAPFTMRVEFEREELEGELQRSSTLAFHVCDDGRKSYVHVGAHGAIYTYDGDTGTTSQAGPSSSTYYEGQKYTLEIVHDGRKVTTSLDGVEAAKADTGRLVGGGIEVMAICDGPAFLHKLEITGKVDPASLVVAKKMWAARTLTEMGF